LKLTQIAAAAAAIENGTWVPSPSFPGVSYLVRGSGNAAARRLREKLVSAIPRAARMNGLSEDDATRIETQVIAEAIWFDVKGLSDESGDIALTPAKALELLGSAEYGALLRADIRAAAAGVGEDELAGLGEDAKN
jgi:hypothetical protein